MRILGYYLSCVVFIIVLHSWLKRNGNSAPSLRFLFCAGEKKQEGTEERTGAGLG